MMPDTSPDGFDWSALKSLGIAYGLTVLVIWLIGVGLGLI